MDIKRCLFHYFVVYAAQSHCFSTSTRLIARKLTWFYAAFYFTSDSYFRGVGAVLVHQSFYNPGLIFLRENVTEKTVTFNILT